MMGFILGVGVGFVLHYVGCKYADYCKCEQIKIKWFTRKK